MRKKSRKKHRHRRKGNSGKPAGSPPAAQASQREASGKPSGLPSSVDKSQYAHYANSKKPDPHRPILEATDGSWKPMAFGVGVLLVLALGVMGFREHKRQMRAAWSRQIESRSAEILNGWVEQVRSESQKKADAGDLAGAFHTIESQPGTVGERLDRELLQLRGRWTAKFVEDARRAFQANNVSAAWAALEGPDADTHVDHAVLNQAREGLREELRRQLRKQAANGRPRLAAARARGELRDWFNGDPAFARSLEDQLGPWIKSQFGSALRDRRERGRRADRPIDPGRRERDRSTRGRVREFADCVGFRGSDPGPLKTIDFQTELGLRNRRNLLRRFGRRKESFVSDGAARDETFRGKRPGNSRVSQSVAGARASFREEPRSLEGEIQDAAGTDQGVSHRGARLASVARSVASQSGGIGTGNRRTALPVATASRAVPPAPSRRSRPILTQLSS